MTIDHAILKAELDTDPKGLGYADMNDYQVADKLNEIGATGEIIVKDSIAWHELLGAVDPEEYLLLSDAARLYFQAVSQSPILNAKSSKVSSALTAFAVGAKTTAAIQGLMVRLCSRAEAIGIVAEKVMYWDIGQVRALK